ncbi:Rubrerythrin, partial [Dysosmobacter welbionis]
CLRDGGSVAVCAGVDALKPGGWAITCAVQQTFHCLPAGDGPAFIPGSPGQNTHPVGHGIDGVPRALIRCLRVDTVSLQAGQQGHQIPLGQLFVRPEAAPVIAHAIAGQLLHIGFHPGARQVRIGDGGIPGLRRRRFAGGGVNAQIPLLPLQSVGQPQLVEVGKPQLHQPGFRLVTALQRAGHQTVGQDR